MSDLNRVTIIGRLGQDPDIRHTAGQGTAVGNFSIATNAVWKDKDGQKQERVEWHRVVVWGKLAELCGEYLHKGSQAYVEGRLQTRKWEDKEGVTKYTTEIVANQVIFLGGGADKTSAAKEADHNYGPPPMGDENLPF